MDWFTGPRRIFTSQPIKKGAKNYLVRLGHFGRRAWLYVENLGNITGRSPGNLMQLDVMPILFIGIVYLKAYQFKYLYINNIIKNNLNKIIIKDFLDHGVQTYVWERHPVEILSKR